MTDSPMGPTADGLLDSLRVLDFTLWQPGHYATQLLADHGADVLKVEPPGGDRMRTFPDRFEAFNGWKRSVVLDLKVESDLGRALSLAAAADVVVEGYMPGVADRLGIGYPRLSASHPSLVYCSISGFGQTGPLANSPGHDPVYQAYAGALDPIPGRRPERPRVLIGDQGGGLAAAFEILAAVLCAQRTGLGDHIDLAITDVIASWVAPISRSEDPDGRPPPVSIDVFGAADGLPVMVGVASEDHFWDSMCRVLALPEYLGMSFEARTRKASELREKLAGAIARYPRAEILRLLEEAGVPAGPILSRPEMLAHPHFTERGMIRTGPDGRSHFRHPALLSNHPVRGMGRAPSMGQGGETGFGSQ